MFLFNLSLFQEFTRSVEDTFEGPIDFIRDHHQNPLLWLVFFFLGIAIFHATYNALEKEK